MIPKTIHYCWFGRNPLPASAIKCINSWRKFFPDYEIKEWNEDNFDVNMIPYTAEAYQAKKYAFVSDFARFWILYHYGGVYFDTDVEVIRPMEDILERGPFMGIEVEGTPSSHPLVNPGLGIATEARCELSKNMIDYYSSTHFMLNGEIVKHDTVVMATSRLLMKEGEISSNEFNKVGNIWIYPKDFFNPYDDITGRLEMTANTRSIHWYSRSWQNRSSFIQWMSRMSHRIFGLKLYYLRKRLSNRR